MTRLNVRSWHGFTGGVLASVVAMAAMGAATTATNPMPRYSTQCVMLGGGISLLLAVTDNQTDKLYMYSADQKTKEPEFKLSFAIDLSQAGKTLLKGEAAEKPTESPSKPLTK